MTKTNKSRINDMLYCVQVNCHSSIRIDRGGQIVYIDPFMLNEVKGDASVIFITHTHSDHLSTGDIAKVANSHTRFICTEDAVKILLEQGYSEAKITAVKAGDCGKCKSGAVEYKVFPAYNQTKAYHPREKGWVGYRIKIDGATYTYTGDSDAVEELTSLSTDILFLPIGGKYTMSAVEAAQLCNEIRPLAVIPVHYNYLIGDKRDEEAFTSQLDEGIYCKVLL